MDFFSGSGSRKFLSFHLGKEMSDQPSQAIAEYTENKSQQDEQAPEVEVVERPADLSSIIELISASETKSC